MRASVSLRLVMNRYLTLGLATLLLIGLLAGCSQPPEGDTAAPDKSGPADGATDAKTGETTK